MGSPLEARFLPPASPRTLPVSGRPVRGENRSLEISAGMADSRLSRIEEWREKSQVLVSAPDKSSFAACFSCVRPSATSRHRTIVLAGAACQQVIFVAGLIRK
jgi:hypothetical protein